MTTDFKIENPSPMESTQPLWLDHCELPKPGVRKAEVTRPRQQQGFSLIEVLVTVLILAFGLLGVAGLLVKGVSNAASSEAMTKASQLAGELADRMRANPAIAVGSGSQYLLNTSNAQPVTWTSAKPTDTEAATSVALKDKQDWMKAIETQLPSGRGRVTNNDTQRSVLIEVAWSNCLGTISDTDKTTCTDNSATAFKQISFELRL